MTQRQTLERQRRSLAEIRDIMNSMKTLAFLETRKLLRFLNAQHTVVQSMENAAADLLGFHPDILPEAETTTPVFLLIGTERGFCGDFNHTLLRALDSAVQAHPAGDAVLIAVGHKLAMLMEENERAAIALEGASVAEEVPALLDRLVTELTALHDGRGMFTLYCLHHGREDKILNRQLLPPFQALRDRPPAFGWPLMLHREPKEVLVDLANQYLFAALNELLYTSLKQENEHRVAHLEGAVRQLDDKAADLQRRCNALRQEEIVEEIEVILLSATGIERRPGRGTSAGTGQDADKGYDP